MFISSALIGGLSPAALANNPKGAIPNSSVSIGTPMGGRLENGEVLPKKGSGYVLIQETQRRRARFGASELVALVKEVAFRVQRKYRGSVLGVADLSRRLGGRIDHHGSHQNGRDVDFLFYLLDIKGKSIANHAFVPIDANGYSTEPPMAYRFDTPRNWALIEALLTSKKAIVQWIFVSDAIKALLLTHAQEVGASPLLIRQAEQVLRQPGKKLHMDHFHVRIYCPRTDKPACDDIGPRWAWTR
ncbi:MAG: penicillin-insensitive murein endopeptidase [Myxococcota bacterium]|nr:penicillin-insensitive murein endopeptidase [Myxococcota bacterium]